jgi:hypothetical protein
VSRTLSVGVIGACLVVAAAALPGRASLYQPDAPVLSLPAKADGPKLLGEPLPFDQFKMQFVRLSNVRNPELKDSQGKNPDREQVLTRVGARRRVKNLPPAELAALAGDMLRLGNSDPRAGGNGGFFVEEAVNLLKPRTRDRVPNYFVFTTLAQLHAARGEWSEALTNHQAALLDAEMPAEVKGLSKAQRDWEAQLDADYVPHYYAIHRREAEARPRPAPESEEPTPLFPLPERDKPHTPVRFVNDAGQYEPGTLAAAERAKLPPDAVAVVQQLLLWFPSDARLYWLLAELYAADGKLDEAAAIMDECVWGRQYGNRKLLMDHRAAIRTAIEERQRAEEEAQRQKYPISLRTVVIYFGAVVALAVVAAVRVLTKRAKGNAGPTG